MKSIDTIYKKCDGHQNNQANQKTTTWNQWTTCKLTLSFSSQAYYRAGQAAIKQKHWWEGEEYAKCGIFICGETKELRQILDDAATIPLNDGGEK